MQDFSTGILQSEDLNSLACLLIHPVNTRITGRKAVSWALPAARSISPASLGCDNNTYVSRYHQMSLGVKIAPGRGPLS